jgi:hypothetical protein
LLINSLFRKRKEVLKEEDFFLQKAKEIKDDPNKSKIFLLKKRIASNSRSDID